MLPHISKMVEYAGSLVQPLDIRVVVLREREQKK